MRIIKWIRAPAFSYENYKVSYWVIKIGIAFHAYLYVAYPEDVMVHHDIDRGLAIADGMLRDASFNRLSEACYTDKEIKEFWYKQEFMKSPKKSYVMARGREALCGGRWMCGCNKVDKPPKPEVSI